MSFEISSLIYSSFQALWRDIIIMVIENYNFILAQEQMLRELQSLPVSKDTVRVKQRKEYLEKKLQEIETAIKIFSRPKVFVKDEWLTNAFI